MTDDPQAGATGAAGAGAGVPPPVGDPEPANRTTQIVIGVVVALIIALLGAWALGFGPFARPAASPGATTAPASLGPTTAPTLAATAEVTAQPTAEPTSEPTAEPTEEPTAESTPEVTPAATPTAIADACTDIASLLITPGRLTLSTDLPAFSPWFEGDADQPYPNEPEEGSAWTEYADFSGEPYSMEGFESATAYAVAERMGFMPELVDWIPNTIFEQAFAPGDKPFDFHMAQLAFTEERAQAVTFSDSYFLSNQSLLAMTPNTITAATTIEELKTYRLGAAANSTSFQLIEDVIQPTVEISVYNDNEGARQALVSGLVDAIVVDLATAFFMRDGQIDDFDTPEPEATIVGQFGPPAEPDQVAFVLELGNPLVDCVNQAIAQIMADGTHETILEQWINTGQDVPFLE